MEVDPNNIDLHQEKSSLVHVTNLDTRFEKKSLQVIIRQMFHGIINFLLHKIKN